MFFSRLVSGAKSGANFGFKAYLNLVKRVRVVILLPRLFFFIFPINFRKFAYINKQYNSFMKKLLLQTIQYCK